MNFTWGTSSTLTLASETLERLRPRQPQEILTRPRDSIYSPLTNRALGAFAKLCNNRWPAESIDDFTCRHFHEASIDCYTVTVQASKPEKE